LPEKLEDAVNIAADAVKTAIEKRQKLADGNLVTFGVLEVRNADFPRGRDAWCRAVAGMLERSLLHRGGAVLERSRLQHVTRERQLTGDDANKLLASMKLVDLEFTRGENAESFKLTARIGNEIFRAESSFDKPLDAVQDIAGQLLESKVDAAMGDEAVRFLREAQFLYNQTRYKAALERAETAIALGLDNANIKRVLGLSLLAVAQFTATPDAAKVEEVIRLGMRALDVIETLPNANVYIEPLQRLRYKLACVGSFGAAYKDVTLEEMFPEIRESARAFHQRAALYLINTRTNKINVIMQSRAYRDLERDPTTKKIAAVARKATEPASFLLNAGGVFDTNKNVLEFSENIIHRSAAVNGKIYEFFLADLLHQYHEIPPEKRDSHPDIRTILKTIMQWFAVDATVLRLAKPEIRDERDLLPYERVIAMLENDACPMFRDYGWIARNSPLWFTSTYQMPTNDLATEYFNKVKQRLEAHPPDHNYQFSLLYEEMRRVALYRVNAQRQAIYGDFSRHDEFSRVRLQIMTPDECLRAVAYFAEVVEIAVRRQENVEDSYATFFSHLREMIEFNDVANRPSDVREQYAQLISDYFTRLGIEPPRGQGIRLLVENDFKKPHQPEPERPKPWSEEIVLFTGRSIRISDPFLQGDTLYFFCRYYSGSQTGNTLRLNSVDLKTLHVRQGVPHTVNSSEGIPTNVMLDDQNAYFVGHGPMYEKKAIRVFPLNGGNAWTLSLDSLPGNTIDTACFFNGKLYVALNEGREIGWFVVFDLDTKEYDILSSTSAREGKAPFVNVSPAPRFAWFHADPPRNRLLFYLHHSRPEWNGLWSMNGETGAFTHHWAHPGQYWFLPQIHDESGLVIMRGSSHTEFLDLRDNDIEGKGLSPVKGSYTGIYEAVYFQNALWGWSVQNGSSERRTLDSDATPELLARPTGLTGPPTIPPRILPLPDEKRMVIADWNSLVLLRFDDPLTTTSE